MLNKGKARKVTVYLNEDTSSTETFAYEQVMKFLYDRRVAGATLIRPQEGFGNHHQRHGAASHSLPVRIEFIDKADVIEGLLPELCELVSDGLVEMHEVEVVTAAKREAPL